MSSVSPLPDLSHAVRALGHGSLAEQERPLQMFSQDTSAHQLRECQVTFRVTRPGSILPYFFLPLSCVFTFSV